MGRPLTPPYSHHITNAAAATRVGLITRTAMPRRAHSINRHLAEHRRRDQRHDNQTLHPPNHRAEPDASQETAQQRRRQTLPQPQERLSRSQRHRLPASHAFGPISRPQKTIEAAAQRSHPLSHRLEWSD
ncbi:hypothetical protein [Tabrizicola sp.]|uniref:hypothetical protein n=1 Tax=Tabrizicola sp. TaxID=2005166 RepID=UPI00286C8A30|nr:hypothetical protein [Tabrizicola sp.]